MEPFERITLLFCLAKDPDPSIRAAAIARIQKIPVDVISRYSDSDKAHPLVLETIIKIGETVDLTSASDLPTVAVLSDLTEVPCDLPDPDDEAPIDEEGEQFLSKFKISQMMGIGEKIKMALTGDKEWRSILVKDSNKLVSGSVVKNPRITEGEVLQLIKSGIQNDEIMRLICSNKEWIKSYKIRKSLIENNRTPVQNSMRYLATMGEKDLAGFAKSKNISSVVSTMAKRLLLSKKK